MKSWAFSLRTTTMGKHGELPQNIWCDSVTQKCEISGLEKQLQTSLKHSHNNQGREHLLITAGWRNCNTHADIHKSGTFGAANSRSRFLKYIFMVFVMTIFKIFSWWCLWIYFLLLFCFHLYRTLGFYFYSCIILYLGTALKISNF